MFLNNQKSGAGFTIMEMIAAVFVVNLGIMADFSLLTQSITYINTTASSLTATYLAQEGVEIARNIRDSNFLKMNQIIFHRMKQKSLKTYCLNIFIIMHWIQIIILYQSILHLKEIYVI